MEKLVVILLLSVRVEHLISKRADVNCEYMDSGWSFINHES